MTNEQLNFFATTAKGMEFLLAQELLTLGAEDLSESRAGVFFRGSLATAYKVCLWSRIASRVLLVLKTVKARDAEQLYRGIKEIRWDRHLNVDNTFVVNFSANSARHAQNENIIHTHFAALKVKDAIVDQFREQSGSRPSVDALNPDVRVNVYLNGQEATVSIDLSGDSLHRRGYREEGEKAPLKENLSAAMLMLSGWPKGPEYCFIDPMCGSGTLPIEAALMAANIAPGLLRSAFGFTNWRGHKPALWNKAVEDAKKVIISDENKLPHIFGFDIDKEAIRTSKRNLKKAGLLGRVVFRHQALSECEPPSAQGIVIVNPPYGERLGEVRELSSLYKQIGDIMKQRFAGYEAYIFTSNPDLAKSVGLKASRRFVLFNGSLECRLLKYCLY